jgi:hypothetical protein
MAAEHESLSLGCRADADGLERLVAPGCHEPGASGGEIGERTVPMTDRYRSAVCFFRASHRHYPSWECIGVSWELGAGWQLAAFAAARRYS